MKFTKILATFFSIFVALLLTGPALAASTTPRLVLQITVDALRGDLPLRYYDRLGKAGFRYLWEKGTVYSDAHHAHATPRPSSVMRPWRPGHIPPCTA